MKRMLSLLLTVAMMLGTFSNMALAEEPTANIVMYHDEVYGDYYALKGLVFCDNPVSDLQYLNIFIPSGYVKADGNGAAVGYDEEAIINGFTVRTAPVIFRNNCAGWMSSDPENMREAGNGFKDYMENGFIYVVCGARSRGLEGNVGKAPAPIVDLKAGIRYLRAHSDALPGNFDRIVSVGGSGAGEMSSLVGATGNMSQYYPYLYEIGAAGIAYDEATNTYTSNISDDVYACMAYYPIADIENADIAYAWMRCNSGETEVTGMQTAVFSDFQLALQQDEAEAYVNYLNSLNLVDENGQKLELTGIREGTFYTQILANMSDALNAYLADMNTSAAAAYAEKLMATNSEEAPWLLKNEDNTYSIINLDGFIQNAGNNGDEATIGQLFKRNKNIPGFDTFNLGAENNAFGSKDQDAVHYSASVAKILRDNYEKYSVLDGFNKEEVDQYINDALTGEYAEDIQAQTYLMNATAIMLNKAAGTEETDIAAKWRIRSGTADQHTSFSIGYIMSLAVSYNDAEVDYSLVWAMIHGGEHEGTSTGTFVEWVNELFASEDDAIDENLSADELYEKANELRKAGDFSTARAYEEKAAEAGHVEAAGKLSEAYYNGNFGEPDYEKALRFAKIGYEGGNSKGMLFYGIMLLYGKGTEQDADKALELIEAAYNSGEMKAARYLGYAYLQGIGISQDSQKAAMWFERGTDNGDLTSIIELGKLYLNGDGVDQDYQKASDLFYKAIDGREDHVTAPAMVQLGVIYENGYGVEADLAKAAEWYQKALDSGLEGDEVDAVQNKLSSLLQQDTEGKSYTYTFSGGMGKELLEFLLMNDGTVQFSLPGHDMIDDVYMGTYERNGDEVRITGLKNVNTASPFPVPGLWPFINTETGNAVILVNDAEGTFTPSK